MLASPQSSEPCDEIPSRVAAFIITGNGLQGWDIREVKWILLMAKHWIKWDMGMVYRDERRVWERQVGIYILRRNKIWQRQKGQNIVPTRGLKKKKPVGNHLFFSNMHWIQCFIMCHITFMLIPACHLSTTEMQEWLGLNLFIITASLQVSANYSWLDPENTRSHSIV